MVFVRTSYAVIEQSLCDSTACSSPKVNCAPNKVLSDERLFAVLQLLIS
jgi:hypothetical protein